MAISLIRHAGWVRADQRLHATQASHRPAYPATHSITPSSGARRAGRINDLVTAFKEGGTEGPAALDDITIRRALVVAEVALAVMLVIGAVC